MNEISMSFQKFSQSSSPSMAALPLLALVAGLPALHAPPAHAGQYDLDVPAAVISYDRASRTETSFEVRLAPAELLDVDFKDLVKDVFDDLIIAQSSIEPEFAEVLAQNRTRLYARF